MQSRWIPKSSELISWHRCTQSMLNSTAFTLLRVLCSSGVHFPHTWELQTQYTCSCTVKQTLGDCRRGESNISFLLQSRIPSRRKATRYHNPFMADKGIGGTRMWPRGDWPPPQRMLPRVTGRMQTSWFLHMNSVKFCAGSKILPGAGEYRHVWLSCTELHAAPTAQAAQFGAGSGLGAYVAVTLVIAI